MNEEPRIPFVKMATGFGQEILKLVKAIADGDQIMAAPEKIEARLNICRECEHIRLDIMGCRKCYCRMQLKAALDPTTCPIGKWK